MHLLLIRETLGVWPLAHARRYPTMFTRSGHIKFEHLRACCGLPPDLVDAAPASQPVVARLLACGVDEVVATTMARDVIVPMLTMDHEKRPSTRDMLQRLAHRGKSTVPPCSKRAGRRRKR